MKKKPPVENNEAVMEFVKTLKELDRRHYYATKAMGLMGSSIRAVCKAFGCSPNTVSRAISELSNHIAPPNGKQRMPGGGAKDKIDRHPEWVTAFVEVVSGHLAGDPMNENVIWLNINASGIRKELARRGVKISLYHVQKLIKRCGLKKRSFRKNIPLKSVEGRDEQFVKIKNVIELCIRLGIPIISIDTKKKEIIGNFKRAGQVLCFSAPECLDHDFSTFADCMIVPHGIYDVAHNIGYMTIGLSHDTSEFVCDNVEAFWEEYLSKVYKDAKYLVILCDGGGSNSSSHHIVKQDFMDLAEKLGISIMMMHYPPYCSKYNPIEHRLFSQITRSWSGAPLVSVQDARDRAAATETKTGLKVFARISTKVYEIGRTVRDKYRECVTKRIRFDDTCHNWNYLISPT